MNDSREPARPRPPNPLRPAERLDPSVFQLPVDRMREGYYSDKYFVRARDVVLARRTRIASSTRAVVEAGWPRPVMFFPARHDRVGTSLAVAEALGERLWGVRLDTASNLVDRTLFDEMGDFDPELGVPVDSYGVGSALIGGRYDYTADVVRLNGEPTAKVGRWYRDDPRMEEVS